MLDIFTTITTFAQGSGATDVVSGAVSGAAGATAGAAGEISRDLTQFLIAFIAYVGGYALIPLMAKRSMGALSQLTGMVNDKSKGIFDRGRNKLTDKSKRNKENRKGIKDDALAIRANNKRGYVARARIKNRDGAAQIGLRQASRRRSNYAQSQKTVEALGREVTENSLDVKAQKAGLKAAEIGKAKENASKLLEQDVRGMGRTDTLSSLVKAATSKDSNDSTVQAAIDLLTTNKDYDGLAEVQEHMRNKGPKGVAQWREAVGSNYPKFTEIGSGLTSDLETKAKDAQGNTLLDGNNKPIIKIRSTQELVIERSTELAKGSEAQIAGSTEQALKESIDNGGLTSQQALDIVNNDKLTKDMKGDVRVLLKSHSKAAIPVQQGTGKPGLRPPGRL